MFLLTIIRLAPLAETQLRLQSDRKRIYAYGSRLLRRTKALSGDELMAFLDAAVTCGQRSEAEVDEMLQAEMVV